MAKAPWSRIREAFEGEWVEIVDCSWGVNSLHPAAGRVRFHSSCRSDLLKKIEAANQVKDSVILFVGPTLSTIQHHAVQMYDGIYEVSVGS